ncbi:cardiolipin synthase [Marinobacter zhejiangensis]|uniref:Cardiolipin synthase n=1 Tax=Marinobacter zhejiangensis TaxID=488535 RepID=A0A1I4MEK5_9GAMM|nr:cardiolipin synthase [Marinobacter zhejiangensis]SFM01659.1 cardiolipin synthase [Marinobacter zhejiangensis]
MTQDLSSLIALGLFLLYALALSCVYRVLLTYRTAPGAIAWIMGLIGAPYVAVPLFLLFGRNRFTGYVRARRTGDQSLQPLFDRFESQPNTVLSPGDGEFSDDLKVFSRLARQPFTAGNHCTVLKDGEATFQALFDAMEKASHYILLEFYIIRSDRVGQRIKSILKRKLADGVKVWFLYDDIGSFSLSSKYLKELVAAGAQVASFGDGNVRRRRFQINFRNHRKLLICDGTVGFVGGINLGDEYLGTAMGQEPWRDTHCQIQGPAVLGLQLAWLEDWNWASNELPQLDWPLDAHPAGDQEALILPTGPADPHETCTLFFLNCINNARERVWIASPYFVPDLQIINALELAALRGVDVRILIPEKSDNQLIRMAAYSYLVQASRAGIGIYQYQQGFMHQKVVLVDDRYAAIGTANLDNRSMRLNFEITALSTAAAFVQDVDTMLTNDLQECRLMTARDYRDRSLLFRISCRAVRLLAPLL